jgi:SAM-dependent methyltransferase
MADLVSLTQFQQLSIFEPGLSGPLRTYLTKLDGYQNSFFWNDVETGALLDGIQCQNLERLTFESDSFDLVISSDIMEHVRKPWKAFEDIHRVLKPGGMHVFSIPVQKPLPSKCIDRVDTSTETDNFLLEPNYHGDGIGGKSLVYIDYGWDIVGRLSTMGFTVSVHSPDDDCDDAQKLVTFITRKNVATRQREKAQRDKVCNICGGTSYIPGPLGRMALNGEPPQCRKCGSLERHRILRSVWSAISGPMLKEMSALQFSRDPSVEPDWFCNFEESIYGNINSIDIQAIDRSDESYDVIICNQILEHVEKDTFAFQELVRILKPNGFLQLTVPNPIARQVTEDWGYAKTEFHGHYRHYGIDLIDTFNNACPGIYMLYIKSRDTFTQCQDYVFFWSKSAAMIEQLTQILGSEFEVMN